jgi:hypothetical protein
VSQITSGSLSQSYIGFRRDLETYLLVSKESRCNPSSET